MGYKKAKNATLRGLRFSISFSQMRNELGRKGTNNFFSCKQKGCIGCISNCRTVTGELRSSEAIRDKYILWSAAN